MLMIIPLLLQGVLAAPGLVPRAEPTPSTSASASDKTSTPELLIPAGGYIDATYCGDAADTRAYRVEIYNNQGMELGNNNDETPGCNNSAPCDIKADIPLSQYTLVNGGQLLGSCLDDGTTVKVTWKNGAGITEEKELHAYCTSTPFTCMLDLDNLVEGTKYKTVLVL